MNKALLTHKILSNGIKWLTSSGIIDRDVGSTTFGAFHYGFSPLENSYLQTYSEITGYGISLLMALYENTEDSLFLNLALHSTKHLIQAQRKGAAEKGSGAFSHGYLLNNKKYSKDFYSFDAGICLSGLCDFYEITSFEPALIAIKAAAIWLTEQAQNASGSFKSRYDGDQENFVPLPSFADWYNDECSLHAKNAIGLLKAADITGKERFRQAALKSLNWVLSLQREDGAFVVHKGEDKVYTHAHCYVLETLLFAISFEMIKKGDTEKKYVEAAEKARDWLIRKVTTGGNFQRYYPKQRIIHEFVTDATAQTARILLCSPDINLNEQTFQKIINFLKAQQINSIPWQSLKGAFISKHYLIPKYGFPALKIMSWPSIFAIHTFLLLKERKEGKNFDGKVLF